MRPGHMFQNGPLPGGYPGADRFSTYKTVA